MRSASSSSSSSIRITDVPSAINSIRAPVLFPGGNFMSYLAGAAGDGGELSSASGTAAARASEGS